MLFKRIFPFIIVCFSSLLILISCASKISNNDEIADKGNIPLNISLVPLQELNVQVTQAIATLSKDNEVIPYNLSVTADNASATINDLNPGVWHILIELFSESYLVASGEADVEVFPGQTSHVDLTLIISDITGSIEINVDWELETQLPERVLFIGNSYTYYNEGLAWMFSSVTESTSENYGVQVHSITGGGLTLQNHFETPSTIETILNGNWDIVVLQEQSQMPILDTETFLTYATKLDSVIDLSGAQTCFFMTWAREYDQNQITGLSSAYLQAGEELNALVVPVGLVYNYVFEVNHEIDLYMDDSSHPSIQGTYLAALCFFQSLFNENAQTATFIPQGINTQDANYLQEAAWDWYFNNNYNKENL